VLSCVDASPRALTTWNWSLESSAGPSRGGLLAAIRLATPRTAPPRRRGSGYDMPRRRFSFLQDNMAKAVETYQVACSVSNEHALAPEVRALVHRQMTQGKLQRGLVRLHGFARDGSCQTQTELWSPAWNEVRPDGCRGRPKFRRHVAARSVFTAG
jgi:hypothetical protein